MSTALNVTHLPSKEVPPVTSRLIPRPIVGIDGVIYRPHPNGGGLVAETALVGATVFVGPAAVVRDRALVVGDCKLFGESVVEGDAHLIGQCVLRHRARVGDHALLLGRPPPSCCGGRSGRIICDTAGEGAGLMTMTQHFATDNWPVASFPL